MRWLKISTLIMQGFRKSNFPPRSWEGNYELLKGSPSSSSSCSSGSRLFHQEISFFIYSVTFLQPENGLRPSYLVTALGARSSWNNSPQWLFQELPAPRALPHTYRASHSYLKSGCNISPNGVFFLRIFTTWRKKKGGWRIQQRDF
jgi:hypothetical protein